MTAIDTKQVSVGQANVVISVARALQANPDMTMTEGVECALDRLGWAKMCFLPDNLEFLRAGGRVSNAACLGSRIFSLHPCIEILDGKLMDTRKYRGTMVKVTVQMIGDYAEKYDLERKELWVVYTVGLADSVKESAAQAAEKCGFKTVN